MQAMPRETTDSAELWARFGTELRAFIARRVPDTDVDDVLQDAFLRIHGGLGNVRSSERIAGWVYRVARSAVVDHLRRRRPAAALPDAIEDDVPVDGRELEREVASWLRPLIATLPQIHREALQLVELEGLSQRDLGRRLRLSPSGARTRVQRARDALRRQLLRCCEIELDARGGVVDYRARRPDCCDCEERSVAAV